jgi:hypothetical protein
MRTSMLPHLYPRDAVCSPSTPLGQRIPTRPRCSGDDIRCNLRPLCRFPPKPVWCSSAISKARLFCHFQLPTTAQRCADIVQSLFPPLSRALPTPPHRSRAITRPKPRRLCHSQLPTTAQRSADVVQSLFTPSGRALPTPPHGPRDLARPSSISFPTLIQEPLQHYSAPNSQHRSTPYRSAPHCRPLLHPTPKSKPGPSRQSRSNTESRSSATTRRYPARHQMGDPQAEELRGDGFKPNNLTA